MSPKRGEHGVQKEGLQLLLLSLGDVASSVVGEGPLQPLQWLDCGRA